MTPLERFDAAIRLLEEWQAQEFYVSAGWLVQEDEYTRSWSSYESPPEDPRMPVTDDPMAIIFANTIDAQLDLLSWGRKRYAGLVDTLDNPMTPPTINKLLALADAIIRTH